MFTIMVHRNIQFWVTKLRTCAYNFIMFVSLPSRPLSPRPSTRMKQLGNRWMDFHEILYRDFTKLCRPLPVLIKIGKSNGQFAWRAACISSRNWNLTHWAFTGAKNVLNKSCWAIDERGRSYMTDTHYTYLRFTIFEATKWIEWRLRNCYVMLTFVNLLV
jgi:hypothetical protein